LLFFTEAELAAACRDPQSFVATNLAYARVLYQRPEPSSATNDRRLATTDRQRSPLAAGEQS
jgi:hypothetical protein